MTFIFLVFFSVLPANLVAVQGKWDVIFHEMESLSPIRNLFATFFQLLRKT